MFPPEDVALRARLMRPARACRRLHRAGARHRGPRPQGPVRPSSQPAPRCSSAINVRALACRLEQRCLCHVGPRGRGGVHGPEADLKGEHRHHDGRHRGFMHRVQAVAMLHACVDGFVDAPLFPAFAVAQIFKKCLNPDFDHVCFFEFRKMVRRRRHRQTALLGWALTARHRPHSHRCRTALRPALTTALALRTHCTVRACVRVCAIACAGARAAGGRQDHPFHLRRQHLHA
jgi:hypothetical protein